MKEYNQVVKDGLSYLMETQRDLFDELRDEFITYRIKCEEEGVQHIPVYLWTMNKVKFVRKED